MSAKLEQKIAVVGLGYVGLPLAVSLSRKTASPLLGFDINAKRINELKGGSDHTGEVAPEALKGQIGSKAIGFSAAAADLKQYNFIIVAVPTPVDAARKPDLKPLLGA